MKAACTVCERPVGDARALCITCRGELTKALQEIPGLYADLIILRSRQARLTSGRTGGRSAEDPLPIRLVDPTRRDWKMQGDRALGHLADVVCGWARVIAEGLAVELPIGAPALVQLVANARCGPDNREHVDPVRTTDAHGHTVHVRQPQRDPVALTTTPATAVEQCAIWLVCHPHDLSAHPAAGVMYTEIADAVAGLRRVVDRPTDRRYLGPCPTVLEGHDEDGRPRTCSVELRAEQGRNLVRCARCRTEHDVQALEAATLARAENEVWTVAELLHVLKSIGTPIPRSTLYDWARTRRITPRGYKHGARITDHRIALDDPEVYRLGDVRDVARRDTSPRKPDQRNTD